MESRQNIRNKMPNLEHNESKAKRNTSNHYIQQWTENQRKTMAMYSIDQGKKPLENEFAFT